MTDPGAPADKQQPGVVEPALPDSAGDPQTEVAANRPHDPAGASSQPISKEVPAGGSVLGIEASAFRFEIVPAFQAKQMAQYLDGYAHWAHDLAQARAELVASALPKISIADYALPTVGTQQAISKMAIPPDLGLFKTNQPAVSLAVSFPAPSVAGTSFPPSATSASIRPSPGWSIPGTTDFSESTSSSPRAQRHWWLRTKT